MDVYSYLARIGCSEQREPTANTLRELHTRHMLTVPFENLDVGHRRIAIDTNSFVRKIVDERRGGFCYELNGAFASLLRAHGFRVDLLSAGVARAAGGFGPEYDHLALLVTIGDDRWLADVGFGDSFVAPLRFVPGEQSDPAGVFRIEGTARVLAAGDFFVLERRRDAAWEPQYRFELLPRRLEEFAAMCDYHQTSPLSSFTQKTVCSLATPRGRMTLSGHRMITTADGQRSEYDLGGDQEWRAALRDTFGIELPF